MSRLQQQNKYRIGDRKESDPVCERKCTDVVIIDTAGRLAIDEVMMNEVANIKAAVKPHEILLSLMR